MDTYSSGEDPAIKTRKPYTITKQRERWTEDEHNRFLEALKLYGRAWQRIEEHLGTKTAVQIRSHAQKFFTKLEKEAIVKGAPIGQFLDIEIPPPRPKRKPNNPYPRKTSGGTLASQVEVKDGKISTPVSSSCQSKVSVAAEKEHEKPCDYAKYGSSNGTAASQVSTKAKGYQMEKSDTKQPFQDNIVLEISNGVDPYHFQEESVDELQQSENGGTIHVHASQNYPRHVPLHIIDGSSEMRAFNISTDTSYADSTFIGGVYFHQNLSTNPESSVHQSFLHGSTGFSSLVVSALSQNPAAVMWPSLNVEASVEPSRASAAAFQSTPLSANPSMAAIAASTVAAATAWWEAHGLLPLCAPYRPCFTLSPASPSATPQGKAANSERKEKNPHPETAKVEVTKAELHDANKSANKKLVDRSSCGSNTPSSSEVEADAFEKHREEEEEKHMKKKDEQEEVDAMHSLGDPLGRRCRSTSNGRLAFDALFSREILPQSFSPHKGKTWSMCPSLISGSIVDGALNTGLGVGSGKVKAIRTGFKPYKRCSVEAKDEEKCPKRLRLEGEGST